MIPFNAAWLISLLLTWTAVFAQEGYSFAKNLVTGPHGGTCGCAIPDGSYPDMAWYFQTSEDVCQGKCTEWDGCVAYTFFGTECQVIFKHGSWSTRPISSFPAKTMVHGVANYGFWTMCRETDTHPNCVDYCAYATNGCNYKTVAADESRREVFGGQVVTMLNSEDLSQAVEWPSGFRGVSSQDDAVRVASQEFSFPKYLPGGTSGGLGAPASDWAMDGTSEPLLSGDTVAWYHPAANKVYDCVGIPCSLQRFPLPNGHQGSPYRIYLLDGSAGDPIYFGDSVYFERMVSGSYNPSAGLQAINGGVIGGVDMGSRTVFVINSNTIVEPALYDVGGVCQQNQGTVVTTAGTPIHRQSCNDDTDKCHKDGDGGDAKFYGPSKCALSYDETKLYIYSDFDNNENKIRVMETSPPYHVSTLNVNAGGGWAIVASPVGRFLYAVEYRDTQQVHQIDLDNNNAHSILPMNTKAACNRGGWFYACAISDDGVYLYLADFYCEAILKVQVSNGATTVHLNGINPMPVGLAYVDDDTFVISFQGPGSSSSVYRYTASTGAKEKLMNGVNLVNPRGLSISKDKQTLYVMNSYQGTIHQVNLRTKETFAIAGKPGHQLQDVDGTGEDAIFFSQQGSAPTSTGELWFVNTSFGTIKKLHCPGTAIPRTTTTTTSTTTTTTTTTAPACNQFQCAAHSPDSAHIPSASSQHGYSFDVCCRCRYGQHLLYGAVAEGDFNEDSKEMSMWIDAPTHIEMTKITWTNGANNDLAFGEDSVGAWVVSSPNHNGNTDQCRTRYTLTRDIDVFFGTGTHFTYNKAKDYLEGMVKLEGDRPMHTTVAGRDKSYMRHMIQDVPVHVALNKTTTVSATLSMISAPHDAYIMITGVAELTSGENGDITLNMNVLSPSCMQETVTLTQGSDFVNGHIQATWDASTLYQYDEPTTDQSLCSQDVTIVFHKADDQWSAQLEFQFQERGASDNVYVNENVNIQITKPHILDSLPIRSTMVFHKLSDYSDVAQGSFGLGQMVYGEIVTTTVVTVDDIQVTRLVLNQINYAGTSEDTDLMHASWAEYSGTYNTHHAATNSFRFAFDLESTHFHVTDSGQLATIFADFDVTYLDGAETHRRRYLQEISLGSQQAVGSFAITASEVASEVTPATYEFLTQTLAPYAGMAAAGVFAIACCYYKKKLNSNKNSYERLLIDQAEI